MSFIAAIEDVHLKRGDVYIYGWLTVVAGTSEGGRRHEDRLITARRPAAMGGGLANDGVAAMGA
jgi:hypothetical protein